MDYKDYKELEVWKKTRELASDVYLATKTFPREEMFGSTNQIRRCAVSIPSNIAEGLGRNTTKDTLHFLFISRGSLFEMETQLFLSYDQNYIDDLTLNLILAKVTYSKRLLHGFINYYQKL